MWHNTLAESLAHWCSPRRLIASGSVCAKYYGTGCYPTRHSKGLTQITSKDNNRKAKTFTMIKRLQISTDVNDL